MSENNLWGPIESNNWQQVPHIKNAVATEQDVQEGRAVFVIDNPTEKHSPLEIQIPSLAYQVEEDSNAKFLVILIQAEQVGNEELVGVRYFEGGNGVCTLGELELISSS